MLLIIENEQPKFDACFGHGSWERGRMNSYACDSGTLTIVCESYYND